MTGQHAANNAVTRPSTGARLVVVGAGPAGMSAALAAARHGVATLVVDTAAEAGGQYYRLPPAAFRVAHPERLGHDWPTFARLSAAMARQPLLEQLTETTVWAVEPNDQGGWRLHLSSGPADAPGRTPMVLDTPALVLAPGAHDRALPFPGWDLPGVYTAGAAQALAKGQRVAVGRRVLVAGTGPFLLPVAESLIGVGARVVAVLEANLPTGWLGAPTVLWRHRHKAAELAGYAAVLARHRVGFRARAAVVAAHGSGHVKSATIARLDSGWRIVPGSERRVAVDAVCVGYGFTPRLELAVAAGCQLRAAGSATTSTCPTDQPYVAVDDWQATSVPGIYAAGEITGIGGADLAAAQGTLAGLAVAARLGEAPPADMVAAARGRVHTGSAFAALLARAHPVRSGWQTWSDERTLICRCEEVSRGELTAALADRPLAGAADVTRTLKLVTRVGLGPCQGRICGRNAAELAAAIAGAGSRTDHGEPWGTTATWAGMARRPLAAPVRLADLASDPTPIPPREESP